jgi:hypothetical protein
MRLQELNRLMTKTNLNAPSPKVNTQRQRILSLLIAAFKEKREVPLPEVMACAAQYSARIHELRAEGWKIANRRQYHAGIRHTFFRLTSPVAVSGSSQDVTPDINRPDRRSAVRNIDSTIQPELLSIPAQPSRWQDPESLK